MRATRDERGDECGDERGDERAAAHTVVRHRVANDDDDDDGLVVRTTKVTFDDDEWRGEIQQLFRKNKELST